MDALPLISVPIANMSVAAIGLPLVGRIRKLALRFMARRVQSRGRNLVE
ncbi:hypothetical protein [Actinomadura sp. NTSP31]